MIIAFVSLQESHFSLLFKWLEMPHVKAWWDRDVVWNMKLIKEKYGSYVQGYKIVDGKKKPIHAYIICIDDKEVGYVQLYNAHDFPREDGVTLDELPRSLAAFDIFIGDPAYVGKGYGSRIMRQFLTEYVFPHYEACFVDPDSANKRAIQAYEKAGFEKIKTVKDGAVTWMLCRRV